MNEIEKQNFEDKYYCVNVKCDNCGNKKSMPPTEKGKELPITIKCEYCECESTFTVCDR